MAITLVLLTAFTAVFGGLALTAFAAADTGTTDTTLIVASTTENQTAKIPPLGMMMSDPGFGRGHCGAGGGIGAIEVSSEYTATVNAIIDSDTDVQNLIAEGYNVTSIRPIIKRVIEADGTLTTKATTAIVTLQNGPSGNATVKVDITEAKVTQIVIYTRTVIYKTTS
jgi:hypothetical protein